MSDEKPSDDEFAHIPTPRRRPSWLGLLAVLLSAYLIVHQRDDLAYLVSQAEPMPLGEATALFGSPEARRKVPLNRHVRIDGIPDFESSVTLDTQGEWKFRRLFLVQGTGRHLLVERAYDPLPIALAERNAYIGRLIPLSKLSFAPSIRAYFSRYVAATHFFEPDALAAALAARKVPLALVDRAGQPVILEANDLMVFQLAVPGRYLVHVPQTVAHKEDAARALVAKAGVTPLPGVEIVPGTPGGYRFEIEIRPEERTAVLSALVDLAPNIQLQAQSQTFEARVSTIQFAEGVFSFETREGHRAGAALDAIRTLRTQARLAIPEDAVLLIEGERPSSHRRTLIATAFFLVFGLFNLVALLRRG